MQSTFAKNTFIVAGLLAFVMILTRGSHMLTPFALPDASVMVFLLGGLLLRNALWFVASFVLAAVIDFGAAAFDPALGFCLTNGYWGMIPAYAAMWLGGVYLAKSARPFAAMPFSVVAMLTSNIAFIVSTQTYYLFSGRFPDQGVWAALQHGWEYYPAWMGYTALYVGLSLIGYAVWQRLQATSLARTAI